MATKALAQICTADNCDRPQRARGYCTMHYQRVKSNGTTTSRLKKWASIYVGHRYGRLTVIAEAEAYTVPSTGGTRKRWLCECDCGNRKIVAADSLKRGVSKSCGCYAREITVGHRTKHGWSRRTEPRHDIYDIWVCMKARCLNPENANYNNYGGRGIAVCDRWLQFENFLADMGERPSKKHSIDRIENNGNYEPGNCRWATKLEQSKNRRTNRKVIYQGEELCSSDLAVLANVSPTTINRRLNKGLTPEQIVGMVDA